jgi:NAD(P)-dependent dehydrogenase (short-subunit alcohol dehydrogenase family)
MTLALELKPARVNVISPGIVDTPTWDFIPTEHRKAALDSFAVSLPGGRVGSAEELADAPIKSFNPRIT